MLFSCPPLYSPPSQHGVAAPEALAVRAAELGVDALAGAVTDLTEVGAGLYFGYPIEVREP